MSEKRPLFSFIERPRSEPGVYPLKVRREAFREVYKVFDETQAREQSGRCIDCGNPYCEWKCPVHNYIPNWLKLAEQGRIIEAAELCHETNTLPEVCGRICPHDRLCEQACTLATGFGAVTIGAIERYIVDEAFRQGWRPDMSHVRPQPWSVGVVGAGPAGLACADVLVRAGVEVMVYDRYPEIGGLLSFGIPDFKLEMQVIRRRREILEGMGINFRLNCEIGGDIEAKELLSMHDALFLGTGAYTPVEAELPGAERGGLVPALPYLIGQTAHMYGLEMTEFPHVDLRGERVLVLGGGDTAMDCVRTAVRQGARSVHCIYRRDRENMPGSRKEVSHAIEEGVEFEFNTLPVGLVHEGGKLSGVEVVQTELVADPDGGRARPRPVQGSDKIMAATAVIVAFGFRPSPPSWLSELGVKTRENGTINAAGPGAGQSSNPDVFAAGDNVRGADLVVTAIADARQTGKAILQHLAEGVPRRRTA